ncbi:hypothetical protein EDI_298300 [Entamoeba dispar SAW760]|uniref:Uncharacterized protein n=1 Tax=Entamoeba dispar (strain ATCC PRA-260 / SAW760) TaxID=370354 RepID=B0E6K2_ENTDS|nr:uncharacterized protein EDI_298300 [Entamoeba dispar SAW760]EDR29835.1 hypothetical protein EDI_298300 [Entamoeba dispar SAW760]|eukprot:EDR29835.1 hypothetical protein EDI_298300 [Entamoeba dispar SAW760]
MPRRRSSSSSRKSNEKKKAKKRNNKGEEQRKLEQKEKDELKEYLEEKKKYFEDVDNFKLDTVIEDPKKPSENNEETSLFSFDRPNLSSLINSGLSRESISIIPREPEEEKSDDSFINRPNGEIFPSRKEIQIESKELDYISQK